jgi:hypothetical protein
LRRRAAAGTLNLNPSTLTVLALLHAKHGQHHGPSGERSFWTVLGEDYVRKLVAGVQRHIPKPYHFTLLTDVPELFPDLDTRPLSGVGAAWWAKLDMFRPENSSGKCLYLDLDNVLSGDLTELVSLPVADEMPLWGLDDVLYPGDFNASTMLFDADHPAVRAIATTYDKDPRGIEARHAGGGAAYDQTFIKQVLAAHGRPVGLMQNALPFGYVLNSRGELEQGADWSQCHLVYGSWDPKPHQSSHPYYQRHWRRA